MAHGLDPKRVAAQIDAIDQLNEKLDGFRLLKSTEVDILENGRLDLPDSILKRLDLVVGAVHSNFNPARERQTERIMRAMDDPHFTVLAHPTERLINKRPPYEIDLERLLEAVRERGCFVEANSQPDRLDLNDARSRMAKDAGVKVSIATDAHSAGDLALIRFGIDQA
jgi:DNA polymerase (family X)